MSEAETLLVQLRCLKALHETPGFRAAAGRMFISDRKLRRELTALEEATGVHLVDRTDVATVTPDGERILTSGIIERLEAHQESIHEAVAELKTLLTAQPDPADVT
ncbi:LysR family transcriptional regulator [Myceligenerans crystallogenes]|uniref:HTH lysR-type domain-containing protein n=1 Tax=Myceligenerans crystallogenes TaxID=316335 RepID=A0ABN2N4I8_9MICO